MYDKQFDFLIVGSGAGGATLAKELSRKGKKVIVVEQGRRENKMGTFKDALQFFDTTKYKTPRHSKEGVILWRTIMAGGSTIVSCGNSTRCLEEELDDFGITLDDEFAEVENEMDAPIVSESLLSEGSIKIMDSARELGYEMDLMPKFINPTKCQKCGQCVTGCSKRA
ncbi:MAG: NAD(P)-binding protein, partial [Bacillota bacterium]